ncbi:MAG: aerial mycelium formation protein [Actinomycetota bacterium]
MKEGRRRLDRVLDPTFPNDLQSRTTDEIRAMRMDCSEEEALLSYERRLIHGRLAILRAELELRAGGDESDSIVDRLPQILAGESRGARGSFTARDPNITFQQASRRVTKLVSDDTLINLPSLSDEEIRAHVLELEGAELEVSETRVQVFAVLDRLTEEIARRYKTGEANPGDLLASL